MNVWDASHPTYVPADVGLAAASYYLIGNLFPGANTNISKAISLYRFLLENKDQPAADLRKRILENGKPLFSEKDMKVVLDVIQRNAGTHFSQRLVGKQVGGDPTAAATKPVAGTVNVAVVPGSTPAPRTEFWDAFFEKLAHPVTSRIPNKFDGLIWYIFILQHLEEFDFIGPVISTALDSVTLSLPVFAELAKTVAERILMLAPVPYAGLAGEMLGTAISFLILSVAIVLNMSRHRFGSAFKAALEAVPFFGDLLMDMAVSIETAAMRYEKNRKRILDSIDKYSPHTEDVLAYWTPTVEVVESDPVFFDLNKAKMDLVNKAVEELGLEDAMSIVSDPSALTAGAALAVPNLAKAATAAAAVPNLAKAATAAATVPNLAKAAAAVPSVASVLPTVSAQQAAAVPKKGGAIKRKTRRLTKRLRR